MLLIDNIIEERTSEYGDFNTLSDISQKLKQVMYNSPSYNNLLPYQKEALEMIQHKISRIINGNYMYEDSWKDIAGYAEVTLKYMKKNNS